MKDMTPEEEEEFAQKLYRFMIEEYLKKELLKEEDDGSTTNQLRDEALPA